MNQRSIYILKDNTVRELPMMNEPSKDNYMDGSGMDYLRDLTLYERHCAGLRTIQFSFSAGSLFKDGQILEEGKDYCLQYTNSVLTAYPIADHIVEPNEMVSGKEVGEDEKSDKYAIVRYYPYTRMHQIRSLSTGEHFTVDLFVDASFPEIEMPESITIEEIKTIESGLVGKVIEVEKIIPLSYAACHIKIKTNP